MDKLQRFLTLREPFGVYIEIANGQMDLPLDSRIYAYRDPQSLGTSTFGNKPSSELPKFKDLERLTSPFTQIELHRLVRKR